MEVDKFFCFVLTLCQEQGQDDLSSPEPQSGLHKQRKTFLLTSGVLHQREISV